MTDSEFEELRWEMIDAFYAYSKANPWDLPERINTWDRYCYFRERFLKEDCEHKGLIYKDLKQQLADIRNGDKE